jgi:hypothetical protein
VHIDVIEDQLPRSTDSKVPTRPDGLGLGIELDGQMATLGPATDELLAPRTMRHIHGALRAILCGGCPVAPAS